MLTFFSMVCLYHGSPVDDISILEPRKRYTPGQEQNSPAGVYASDDPAFAAAHAFSWSSSEGIDLYYLKDENDIKEHVVLEIPKELQERLNQPVFIYEVSPKTFVLMNIPPYGHNFRSLDHVKCTATHRFKTVQEAIESYGGEVSIIK